MNILITGATGVIGSRVVPLLTAAGHRVTAAVRSQRKGEAVARAGATPLALDLFDLPAVERAMAGHDTVINLATHLPGSIMATFLPGAWRENDRLRRDASAILTRAATATGVNRFIQESFAPVYPDRGDEWIDETTPIAPVRYNRSVADAEAVNTGFAASGRIGVILRFAAFYGPDAFQTKDLARGLRFGWALIPGRPDAFISSVSHDDAARAVVAALDAPSGIYNVADDEPVWRREYFASFARALGLKEPRILPGWMAAAFGSLGEMLARSERISNRKFRHATNWSPRYRSVREGFPPTVAAMRTQDDKPMDQAA